MADRFFAAQPITGATASVAGAEAHHLIHVLRAKPGLAVTLFDGSGAEFLAQVIRVGRSEVELAIVERQEPDRELPLRLTVGVALPKQDRQRWLVEKMVELGVARLVPLLSRRAVAQPSPEALDRLRRTVVEASKQCGRNRLMEIAPGQAPAEFFAGFDSAPVRLLAHPGGRPLRTALAEASPPLERATAADVLLAIGPEGGFTDDEVAAAESLGWQKVDLGSRILRIETAACAGCRRGVSAGSPKPVMNPFCPLSFPHRPISYRHRCSCRRPSPFRFAPTFRRHDRCRSRCRRSGLDKTAPGRYRFPSLGPACRST